MIVLEAILLKSYTNMFLEPTSTEQRGCSILLKGNQAQMWV